MPPPLQVLLCRAAPLRCRRRSAKSRPSVKAACAAKAAAAAAAQRRKSTPSKVIDVAKEDDEEETLVTLSSRKKAPKVRYLISRTKQITF